jgi:hypothetical protein
MAKRRPAQIRQLIPLPCHSRKILYKCGGGGVYSMETAKNQLMKTTIRSAGLMILGIGLVIGGCARKKSTSWESIKNPEVVAQLKSFVAEKEAQANAVAKTDGQPMPVEFKTFFAAAERGDWLEVSNTFLALGKDIGHSDAAGKPDFSYVHGTRWEAVKEIWGGLDAFGEGEAKYSALYANDIIESIPPGSIYFGGTDPGRFLITAMQKSHVNGDPFFTVTQNALADETYLDYLRSMYGDKIYIPTATDAEKAFRNYTEDVQQRLQNHQLKPGENVQADPASGRVQISGQVAVMEINALLAKIIFDKNTNQEFYVEESFPLDWMYPHLEPNGLIMKINRQPLTSFSDEIVQRDHDYWTKTATPMIGDWLNSDTSVKEVAAFAEKAYVKKDFNGFKGDPRFIQNSESQKMFSKERSSIAGLYAWRAQHATDAAEKKRMNDAADFAFRQSWALCPYSPEAVIRYANLLMSEGRFSDALLVAETTTKMPEMKGSNGAQMRGLVDQLKKIQRQVKGI